MSVIGRSACTVDRKHITNSITTLFNTHTSSMNYNKEIGLVLLFRIIIYSFRASDTSTELLNFVQPLQITDIARREIS